MKSLPRRVAAGFADAIIAIFTDRSVFSLLILAAVAYSFFYPAAYTVQTVTGMPVIVVDEAPSPLTRDVIRKVQTLRAVDLLEVTPSLVAAEDKLRRREAEAILYLPAGLERGALHGDDEHGGVALLTSGAYLIRTRGVAGQIGEALMGSVQARVEPLLDAAHVHAGATVVERPLFNVRSGYGSYVVPAVATLIIHQTLLLGIGMLVAGRRRDGWRPGPAHLAGMALAFIFIGTLNSLYYSGFVFWFQDYPRGGHWLPQLVATPVFVTATVMLALLLASFFDDRDRPAQMITASSVPLFFISGVSWPLSSMPAWVAAAAWLLPSTAGIRALLKVNQMQALLPEIAPELIVLLALALVFGSAAWWRLCRPPGEG